MYSFRLVLVQVDGAAGQCHQAGARRGVSGVCGLDGGTQQQIGGAWSA